VVIVFKRKARFSHLQKYFLLPKFSVNKQAFPKAFSQLINRGIGVPTNLQMPDTELDANEGSCILGDDGLAT
jgi:hypothetical protein